LARCIAISNPIPEVAPVIQKFQLSNSGPVGGWNGCGIGMLLPTEC